MSNLAFRKNTIHQNLRTTAWPLCEEQSKRECRVETARREEREKTERIVVAPLLCQGVTRAYCCLLRMLKSGNTSFAKKWHYCCRKSQVLSLAGRDGVFVFALTGLSVAAHVETHLPRTPCSCSLFNIFCESLLVEGQNNPFPVLHCSALLCYCCFSAVFR